MRSIEARVSGSETATMVRARRSRRAFVWIGGTTALFAAALVLSPRPGAPDAVFRDPTGRIVAEVQVFGETATVSLAMSDAGAAQEMVWHLWGLPESGSAPVSLGRMGEGHILAAARLDFSRYAMSLENISFSGVSPQSVVIPLALE